MVLNSWGRIWSLLKEIVPNVKRVAIFWIPTNPAHVQSLKDLVEPARLLAIEIRAFKIVSADDFEGASRTASTESAAGIWIFGDPLFITHRARLATLALNVRLPT